ncbi:MAG: hypothetical protein HC888_07390 [Candidatus Competibacteraceae bacterium]|nr:hypothetical protein [Candidatus Competibacteraceae bacterium]
MTEDKLKQKIAEGANAGQAIHSFLKSRIESEEKPTPVKFKFHAWADAERVRNSWLKYKKAHEECKLEFDDWYIMLKDGETTKSVKPKHLNAYAERVVYGMLTTKRRLIIE